jgi:hypothetical protein
VLLVVHPLTSNTLLLPVELVEVVTTVEVVVLVDT